MDLDDFVEILSNAAPSMLELEKSGLSREEAAEFSKLYRCVKREQPLPAINGPDQLLELLRQWDLSKVEIGMIRFPEPPFVRLGTIYVGKVEADHLVMSSNTGEVAVHEFGTKEHLLWPVASSGTALLNALAIAVRCIAKRTVETSGIEDNNNARSAAIECATVAGGVRYLDFFEMLLGVE